MWKPLSEASKLPPARTSQEVIQWMQSCWMHCLCLDLHRFNFMHLVRISLSYGNYVFRFGHALVEYYRPIVFQIESYLSTCNYKLCLFKRLAKKMQLMYIAIKYKQIRLVW